MAKGINRPTVIPGQNHSTILEPFSEIPAAEQWLYANKRALKQLKKGLKEAASGKIKTRGGFSKYLDEA